MGKAEFAHGKPVVAVTVGGDELEASSIREIPGLTRTNSLVPHSLESKLGGGAKVSVTLNMDSLDAVTALNFLVTVKLD